MGYTTSFEGEVEIDPPLNEHEIGFLKDLNDTRRMHRSKGPLFVKGSGSFGQGSDVDIINYNNADVDAGQPGLWCQWTPSDDGATLSWDGNEKFYNAAEWMKYIVTNLLSENSARAYVNEHLAEDSRLQHFTFDHVVNGEIHAQGEDSGDRWVLIVKGGVVMVAETVRGCKTPTAV